MDGVFPPQFPVLVSSSSLDALIYASAPQACATQTRNSSLPSFHHLRSALVAKGYVPTSMLSQDILCTPRSSLDEEKRPPLPPKDWSPNRSHLRTLSRSSRQSAGSPSRSPAGSTRRVFSIRAPRPRLPFALDLTLPGSTAANSPEPFTPPLSGSPTLCESPRSSSPERSPLLKLPTHPDYVEWDGGNKEVTLAKAGSILTTWSIRMVFPTIHLARRTFHIFKVRFQDGRAQHATTHQAASS